MLTNQSHSDMPSNKGVVAMVKRLSKGIYNEGMDRWVVRVYYQGKSHPLTYDRRGNKIRSETQAMEVRYEALSRIENHTFEPSQYQKSRGVAFSVAIRNWWDKNKSQYSPKSQKDGRLRIENVLIPFFRDVDMRDISSKMLDDFQHELTEQVMASLS